MLCIKFGAIESVLKKIILIGNRIKIILQYYLLWYKDVFVFESREWLKKQSADIQIKLGDIIKSRNFHFYIIIAGISNIYSRIAIYHSTDKVETVPTSIMI